MKIVVYLFLTSILSIQGLAKIPNFNTKMSLPGSKIKWQIKKNKNDVEFLAYASSQKKPIVSYDISDCVFCNGKEDNCKQDGVIFLNQAIGITCHVGAHSQRILIFDFLEKKFPSIDITGAYFIKHTYKENKLEIKYDRYKSSGFETKTTFWKRKKGK